MMKLIGTSESAKSEEGNSGEFRFIETMNDSHLYQQFLGVPT